MILAVAATEFEMQPFARLLAIKPGAQVCSTLVAGVGLVETTLRLTRFLEKEAGIDWVLNFGVAGAYITEASLRGGAARLLDLCLAGQECLGDFGICFADRIEALDEQLAGPVIFPMDGPLLDRAADILIRHGWEYRRGNFVTVSAASASGARGAMLAARFAGLCENMEGAAVARVCAEFALPMVELRAVSNLVEDRDLSRWQLAKACERAADAAFLLTCEL